LVIREFGQDFLDLLLPDESVPQQVFGETHVFLATGQQLADQEVKRVETPAGHSASEVVADGDQTALPPARRRGGLSADAVGVVTELLVERRALADGAVNDVGPLRPGADGG